MDLGKQNILFFTRTMMLGGTENVVLQLCEVFKPKVNKIVVCSCGGVNVEKLTKMGIRHYQIPDISSKKDIFKICRTVKKIVEKEQITVIHSHHRMAAFYTEILFGSSIIKIANAHNTFFDKKLLTRFAYRNTKVIAVGEMVKKNLVGFYKISSEQITVIHNAIKPFDGKISPIPLLTEYRENGYKIIGNVGRLSEQKGMEYFINAVPGVIEKFPKTKFVIVGDGEDKDKLVNMVKQMNLDEYITFLGYRSDIQNVMSQMDFIVLSSLWEGLPLTPIEAFSVGKTVVATAVDGTPEIVQNGINGILIKPKDIKEIVNNICYLLNNIDVLDKFHVSAKERYNAEFSFEKLRMNYIGFYRIM
uniref:glycosyltransferase family 4 protein n=1 Tax=Agathobacter rectalis TaxID=39491 RepID=UPI003FEFDAC4